MSRKAPGKSHREGISIMELMDMFPDETSAIKWFEAHTWPTGRCCGHCGSTRTREVPNAKPMPYWCSDCRSYFSVRTGTALERSKVPLRKWAIAIYLEITSLKSVSSMKLHRDIKVSQPTAWFMLHRLREAWSGGDSDGSFSGPVEVDEAYFGGRRANMSNAKRKALAEAGAGRGAVGKTAVIGAKDRATKQVRARVITETDKPTLQGFVMAHTAPGATVYSDEASAYEGLPFNHETVKHSVAEYVRGMAHTNGIESFWAMLKRAHKGTFHKISPKHLNRYVQEFAGKHNIRDMNTVAQMAAVAAGLIGKRLMYRQLIAPNGLDSGRGEGRFTRMSADEQDRIIAGMVKERRELRKTISCLKQKLTWTNRDLNEAANLVRHALQGSIPGAESGITYVSADELVETLEQYRDAHTRLAEINKRLDDC